MKAQQMDVINAEWQSDPTAVACFDLRIVNRTAALLANWRGEG